MALFQPNLSSKDPFLLFRQLAILAQARLPQFLKGGELLQQYSKQRCEALVQQDKQGNYRNITW